MVFWIAKWWCWPALGSGTTHIMDDIDAPDVVAARRYLLSEQTVPSVISDTQTHVRHGFDTQRSFIDRYVDFTPGLAVCSAMFARVLFHLFGSLDPGTVDQKMQRAIAAISNINSQSFLPVAQGAEIRNRPSQASQARQVFNKTVGLS